METNTLPTDNDRRNVIKDLVDDAIEYNNRHTDTFASVNYTGGIDGATVMIQDSKEFTVIANAYIYFGKLSPILATTMDRDYQTAKNLLK